MEINYTVHYHPTVVSNDIPKLNGSWQKMIKKAIEQKLTTQPLLYGVPLRKNFHGLFKLRVNDYRVIYMVTEQDVKVIAILHRSVVYANNIEHRII